MDNPGIGEDNIPSLHTDPDDDDDYDDYKTPNTSRSGETSFIVPGSTEKETALTLQLKQKVKRDKLAAFYRHLNISDNLDLINLDRFKLAAGPKKGATIFKFYNGDKWVPLTKQIGEFLAPTSLRDRFGGVNAMKSFLGVDETPPGLLERSFKAATKLKSELPTNMEMESIPLEKLSSLAEHIHIKTQEALQNTSLDMREFLGID